ncbi:Leucine-rich repeat-containing protein [Cynara cardunculus var. scolymus]|uniref:Leucine-rich repeat-containing protein n=1 Tax=Cynara cardunculus var. scolymus TaxID=59895 RepID=A0A103XX24_CYNCS|nr:Leucine-rich repeat-containing protein [Cynara cardunculus var. scolymus]
MGCIVNKTADAKADRLSRWSATGISFPDEVLELDRSVRTLDLTHNKLADIPEEISRLTNMQRLILADNVIERLPSNVGKLQSLKFLILDQNRVTILPDEMGQLVRLERLSILGNQLTGLPDTIGSLRNLLLLNVSKNQLKFLPESIGSCFSLEELQANENSIEELPPSIPPSLLKSCKALQNISLHGNPISMDQFQTMEGFQEFEARRKRKFDKQIDSNVMIGSKGLDEGVDLMSRGLEAACMINDDGLWLWTSARPSLQLW